MCFGQFLCPSSGVFHCKHSNGIFHTGLLTSCEQNQDGFPSWSWSVLILIASCQQTCMTYTIAVYTVKNSWWWREELSETCRVFFFEKLVHLVGFIVRMYPMWFLSFRFTKYIGKIYSKTQLERGDLEEYRDNKNIIEIVFDLYILWFYTTERGCLAGNFLQVIIDAVIFETLFS